MKTNLYARLEEAPKLVGRDLVREVMPTETSQWDEPLAADGTPLPQPTEGGEFLPITTTHHRKTCCGTRLWYEMEHRKAPYIKGLQSNHRTQATQRLKKFSS